MQKYKVVFVGLLIVALQGCVYRMDIEQGNRIEQSKLEQLELGMTRSQVEYLLGEAAISDLYHANQAHYVFYLFDGKKQQTELKSMVLTYDEEGILKNIEGAL